MKVMFIDESGDHSLTAIDPQYPIFVLGGVIADFKYAFGDMDAEVRRFKREFLDREDLILHTADIVRSQNGFELLRDRDVRDRVFAGLNRLMSRLEYTVVACVIRKQEHREMYRDHPLDPYLYSLDVLLERFAFEVQADSDPTPGLVVVEKRNPTLDRELEITWEHLKTRGTRFLRATQLRQSVAELVHWDKSANVAGLQLADLVVSPIGRFVLGRRVFDDFRIVEQKLRRDRTGSYWGSGLVVLPRT